MQYRESEIDHVIEIRGIYDGYSITVLKDGTVINRWAGVPGHEERAARTQEYIDRWLTDEPNEPLSLFEEEDYE